jgi:bacteriocin-like protein
MNKMEELTDHELAEIDGGSCAGAAGLATGLALAAPFTDGLTMGLAVMVLGGMWLAGCQ